MQPDLVYSHRVPNGLREALYPSNDFSGKDVVLEATRCAILVRIGITPFEANYDRYWHDLLGSYDLSAECL